MMFKMRMGWPTHSHVAWYVGQTNVTIFIPFSIRGLTKEKREKKYHAF